MMSGEESSLNIGNVIRCHCSISGKINHWLMNLACTVPQALRGAQHSQHESSFLLQDAHACFVRTIFYLIYDQQQALKCWISSYSQFI